MESNCPPITRTYPFALVALLRCSPSRVMLFLFFPILNEVELVVFVITGLLPGYALKVIGPSFSKATIDVSM